MWEDRGTGNDDKVGGSQSRAEDSDTGATYELVWVDRTLPSARYRGERVLTEAEKSYMSKSSKTVSSGQDKTERGSREHSHEPKQVHSLLPVDVVFGRLH